MKKRSAIKMLFVFVLVTMLALAVSGAGYSASTTKALSTNFTLVNLGSTTATGTILYYKDDGSTWAVDPANTIFSLAPNGGQVQIRQYFDSTMSPGKGSVVASSNEKLGAIVQIQARGQIPTSGAYKGFSDSDRSSKFFVPIVASRGSSSSGTVNSQIVVQNASSNTLTNITIDLISLTGTKSYTKTISSLASNVSFYYDLADETNLPAGWFGSAVVTATDNITVVSNLFLGPDALQSFNAFSQGSLTNNWLVPSFFSRLTNGLSAVVTVQNLSGSTINAHALVLNCIKDSNSSGPASVSVDNPADILDKASYNFNAVTDARFPSNWYGACSVSAPGNVAVIVQLRYVGVLNNNGAAGYEAIPANGTDQKMYVPLIAKRLANGFATVVTIQNLKTSDPTNVTLNYVPSPTECPVAICDISHNGTVGPEDTITPPSASIPAGGSIMRNHRLSAGPNSEVALPDGWVGSLQVISASQPINGFVQLTNYLNTTGDTFMAHDVFTQP